jgi:plasmid stabilization system protein ParE
VIVYWTDTALGHLRGIYEYIAHHSPLYAQRVVDRLTRRSVQFGTFPHAGRMVPELQRVDVREVLEGPYRVIYRVTPDRIDVVAVFHGARQPPWGEIG